MNKESKMQFIGIAILFVMMLAWSWFTQPSQAQINAEKRTQDSIAAAKMRVDSLAKTQQAAQAQVQQAAPTATNDTARMMALSSEFGAFAPNAVGQEQILELENDVFKIYFTSKGGRIKEILLKKYDRLWEDSSRQKHATAVRLLEDAKNRFEYIIPANTSKGNISTNDLYFTPSKVGNTITFRAENANGVAFEQKYIIGDGYMIDYKIAYKGLNNVVPNGTKALQLNWENHLDRIELNTFYEKTNTSIYYREQDESPTYCSCTADEKVELKEKSVKWVSHAHQFFNTTLIAQQQGFGSALLDVKVNADTDYDLKKMSSRIAIPAETGDGGFAMQIFAGPNDYKLLSSYKMGLEDVVSYGGTMLGFVNRWLIRPIFDVLYALMGHKAWISILLLTLLVKLCLFPLSYKMLYTQAKTTALKPDIEKMKAKYGDDQQKIQMEQMKLYNEFGVNPLGGCLPTLVQMPIWMALFRFFPSTIEFRQQGFLWAKDLTGFEEFITLPFNVPFYGSQVSLFAILWAVSLIVFTWYSMKDTDMTNQPPMMKQMQYAMPLLFMFSFNNYAAGLSLYMLFSNVLNIGQTIATKNLLIDHDKVRRELEENKKKPKKKGFMDKLNDIQLQAQEMQQKQQEAQKKNKK